MIDIEKGNASVYADLGMADAAEMQVSAILVDMVSEAIKYRRLSWAQAAAILGMPLPKLSGLLRGQFRAISQATMHDCLNRLGCHR